MVTKSETLSVASKSISISAPPGVCRRQVPAAAARERTDREIARTPLRSAAPRQRLGELHLLGVGQAMAILQHLAAARLDLAEDVAVDADDQAQHQRAVR